MTVAQLAARGSGSLSFRLDIEGFKYGFVTRQAMTQTLADGHQRINGLVMKGVKIKQEADLPRATIKASGITFKIVDIGGLATAAFDTQPTATTWLAAAASKTDTTITVKSTEGFDAVGKIYLDSEVILTNAKTATTFTGCSRGIWDTLRQAHYIPDGAALRYAEVTNQPTVLEGRRARLYAYSQGDDPQGDGEQVWLGIVRGEPRMQGPSWSIACDPISAVLEQELGSDLSEPATPRGVYFPLGANTSGGAAWSLRVSRFAYSGGAETEIPGIVADSATSHSAVIIQGFWETQADWLEDVNIALATMCSGWGTKVYCVGNNSGYHFEFDATSSPDGLSLALSAPPCDPTFTTYEVTENSAGRDATWITAMAVNTRYYMWPSGGPSGGCPRGVFDRYAPDVSADDASSLSLAPPNRIYVGGGSALSASTTAVSISWSDEGGESVDREYLLLANNASSRSMDILLANGQGYAIQTRHWYTPDNLPQIRFGRQYNGEAARGTGTYDFMLTLSASSDTEVNTGSQPVIRYSDGDGIEDWNETQWLAAYTDAPSIAADRWYSSFKSCKLSEIVCPDLQLLGYYLVFDSTGRLTIKRLRLASATEAGTFAITKSTLLVDKSQPSWERGAIGIFNTLSIANGYDARADEYTGIPYVIRDVAAYGRTPQARTVSIEPKSESRASVGYDDAVRIANGVLGIYGNPYAYVQLDVPLTALTTALLGDTVSIDTAQLPGGEGVRGMSGGVGLVTAREIDFYGARITLTLLVSRARIVGYAPSALILDQDDLGGDIWSISVDSGYFVSGEAADDHYTVGDLVLVYRFDSLTAGIVTGTVTVVTGNVVTVAFNATWNPTATADQEWVLTPVGDTDTTRANQLAYAYLADSVGNFDDGSSAKVFAP